MAPVASSALFLTSINLEKFGKTIPRLPTNSGLQLPESYPSAELVMHRRILNNTEMGRFVI